MRLIRFFVFSLALLVAATAGAQSAASVSDPYSREALDKALSKVSGLADEFGAIVVDEPDRDVKQIEGWKTEVSASRRFALQCIEAKTQGLDRVTADLGKLGEPSDSEDSAVSEARKRLADEKAGLDQIVGSCRLLLVDSEKLLGELDHNLTSIKRRQMLHRYPGVIATLSSSPEELEGMRVLVRDYEGEFGYSLLSRQWQLVFWVVLVASLGLIPVVIAMLRQYHGSPPGPGEFTRAMTFAFLQVMRRYGALIAPLVLLLLFWGIVSWVYGSFFSEEGILLSILLFLGTVIAGRTFLAPFAPAFPYLPFDEKISRRFWRAVRFLAGVWASASVLYYATFIEWPLLLALHLRFAFTALFALALGRVVWVFFELRPRAGFGFVRLLVLLVLAGAVGAEFAGYRNLSAFLIQAVMFSVLTLAIVWLISHVIEDFLDSLEEGRYPWQKSLHQWIGIAEGHFCRACSGCACF